MSDYRRVQCFGVSRKPKKAAKMCRRQYVWKAKGSSGNFGRKGIQSCPHCGTLPDFSHPVNRWLNGEISQEQAQEIFSREYNNDGTRKNNT